MFEQIINLYNNLNWMDKITISIIITASLIFITFKIVKKLIKNEPKKNRLEGL